MNHESFLQNSSWYVRKNHSDLLELYIFSIGQLHTFFKLEYRLNYLPDHLSYNSFLQTIWNINPPALRTPGTPKKIPMDKMIYFETRISCISIGLITLSVFIRTSQNINENASELLELWKLFLKDSFICFWNSSRDRKTIGLITVSHENSLQNCSKRKCTQISWNCQNIQWTTSSNSESREPDGMRFYLLFYTFPSVDWFTSVLQNSDNQIHNFCSVWEVIFSVKLWTVFVRWFFNHVRELDSIPKFHAWKI